MHHIQHPHPTHSGVDMTEGNITGHLIRFALPLLAGNIFQQLYNMVDTWWWAILSPTRPSPL